MWLVGHDCGFGVLTMVATCDIFYECYIVLCFTYLVRCVSATAVDLW